MEFLTMEYKTLKTLLNILLLCTPERHIVESTHLFIGTNSTGAPDLNVRSIYLLTVSKNIPRNGIFLFFLFHRLKILQNYTILTYLYFFHFIA